MVSFGIVILNYLNWADTINCVNDFLKQIKNYQVFITVVDNHSSNESFDELTKAFLHNDNVDIIKSEKNLGFARGNNLGYKHLLKKNIDFDFIIVSNDDILLKEQGLYQWIVGQYRDKEFGVLGPDVYSIKSRVHQSPLVNFSLDIAICKKKLRRKQLKKLIIRFLPDFVFETSTSDNVFESDKYDEEQQNITLHGAFLVFSKQYFRYYRDLFDNQTFLYMEENLLFLRCIKSSIKIIYSPKYSVTHLQSVSTNYVKVSNKKRKMTRLKHEVDSLKRYIQVLEEFQR